MSRPTRRVLVIGGTRGTGAHAVRLLAAEGAEVRVLARGAPPPGLLDDLPGVTVHSGDVAWPGAVAGPAADVDGIVYAAGIRSFLSPRDTYAVTVTGVRRTVEAAAPGCRIVFLSSMGADRPSPVRAAVDVARGYGIGRKLDAERILAGSGLDTVSVRAGVLVDRPPGRRGIYIGPAGLPLRARYLVGRADVARVLVDRLAGRGPWPGEPVLDVMWATRRHPATEPPRPP